MANTSLFVYMNEEVTMYKLMYEEDMLVKTNMSDANSSTTLTVLGLKLRPNDHEMFERLTVYKSTIGAL